jgi:hypothetical protein
MGMIERRDCASFLLEPTAMFAFYPLNRYDAVEAAIERFPDLAHAALAYECEDLVRTQSSSYSKRHGIPLDSTVLVRHSAEWIYANTLKFVDYGAGSIEALSGT